MDDRFGNSEAKYFKSLQIFFLSVIVIKVNMEQNTTFNASKID